jgi:hypothetical protein
MLAQSLCDARHAPRSPLAYSLEGRIHPDRDASYYNPCCKFWNLDPHFMIAITYRFSRAGYCLNIDQKDRAVICHYFSIFKHRNLHFYFLGAIGSVTPLQSPCLPWSLTWWILCDMLEMADLWLIMVNHQDSCDSINLKAWLKHVS